MKRKDDPNRITTCAVHRKPGESVQCGGTIIKLIRVFSSPPSAVVSINGGLDLRVENNVPMPIPEGHFHYYRHPENHQNLIAFRVPRRVFVLRTELIRR